MSLRSDLMNPVDTKTLMRIGFLLYMTSWRIVKARTFLLYKLVLEQPSQSLKTNLQEAKLISSHIMGMTALRAVIVKIVGIILVVSTYTK